MALCGILGLAAVIRLYDLGKADLQWDERLALYRASMPLPQLVSSLNAQAASDVFQDTSPPVHHIAIHAATLLGDSNFLVRLPGVLFGVASLLMLFLVGRQFFNTRTGLYCALYGALLQFHVFYSRYMRWYVFFYAFSLLSLYCFRRLLERRTAAAAVAYGLATALMLYTSYLAAPFLAAQGLFACALVLLVARDRARRPEAWRLALTCGLGFALAGVLYLPQVQGQLTAFYTFYRSGGNSFDPYRVGKAFREITLYFRDSDFSGTGLVLAFMAIGLLRPWRGKARTDMPLLLLWCLLPTLVAFFVNVQTQITAKYLVGLLYAVLFFAAAGVDQLSEWLAGRLLPAGRPAHRLVSAGLGVACVLVLCGPNLQYAALYRGWQHTHANWAGFLLTHRQDVDFLMFDNNRSKKVVLTRDLGAAFRYFDAVADHGYKKFFYVAPQGERLPPGLVPVRHMPQSEEVVDFFRGGVASQAPILVHPDREGRFAFTDDFSTFRFFETVWEARNVAPDYALRTLAQYSLDAPGQATWKLVPAGGAHCREIVVRCTAALRFKIRHLPPDARIRLFVGQDPDRLALVDEADYARMVAANAALRDPEAAVATSTLPLRARVPWGDPAAPLYVRLEFQAGRHVASMDVTDLSFEVACDPGQIPAVDPALDVLGNVAANARLVPWTPGVARLGDGVLHAFSADPARASRAGETPSWQSAEALARFQAAHPGLPPVAVIPNPDGSPAFYVYDPHLADSAVALADGEERPAVVESALPWSVRGLSYTGTALRPGVRLGETRLDIPLAVPEGSIVQLNPGGAGLVSYTPLFTPTGFDLYAMAERDNLHITDNTLTCLEDKPCTALYVFASDLPIKGVRTTVYPALKTDKPNAVRVFYRADGAKDRHELLTFAERGPLDISSTYEGAVGEVLLDKPAHILFVGYELSGPGASLRSDGKYPMKLDVLLDASSLPVPELRSSPVSMRLGAQENSAMKLWLGGKPLPIERYWKGR